MATRRWWIPGLVLAAVALLLVLVLRAGPVPQGSMEPGEGASDSGASDADDGGPLLEGRGEAAAAEDTYDTSNGGDEEDTERGTVRLHGNVRISGSDHLAEGGRVAFAYLEPDVEGLDLEQIQRMPREERLRCANWSAVAIGPAGGYTMNMPHGILLERARIVRPGNLDDVLGSFLETEVEFDGEPVLSDRRLDLNARSGLVILGRVVDATSDAPLAGVEILHARQARSRAGGRSDEVGAFRLSGFDPEAWPKRREFELVTSHPGYVPHRRLVRFPAEVSAVEDVHIRLQRGVRIGGRILVDGRPAGGGAALRLLSAADAIGWDQPVRLYGETRATADGRFSFEGVAPIASADVVLASVNEWGRGLGRGAVLYGVDCTRDRDDLLIEVGSTVRIGLGATYPDGVTIPGANLEAIFVDPEGMARSSQVRGPTTRYFEGSPGLVYDVRLFAHRKEPGKPETFYRGSTRIEAPATTAKSYGPPELVVELEPFEMPARPECPEGVTAAWLGATNYARFTWRLKVIDASDDRPLTRRYIELRQPGSHSSTGLSEQGTVFLTLGLGRTGVRIHCEGYASQSVHVQELENGVADATVRLEPLPAR